MRLIDADALEQEYQEQYKLFTWDDGEREKATLARVIQVLHAQPTADVKPVVKGEWIEVAVTDGYDIEGVKTWVSVMQCTQCGFIVNAVEGHMAQYKFCPNCGADMRGEQDGYTDS